MTTRPAGPPVVVPTLVAAVGQDSPEIVVDLTEVRDLPRPASHSLLRLDATARAAGGGLRASCAAGTTGGRVVELEVGRGRLAELGGPVGRAFGAVAVDR